MRTFDSRPVEHCRSVGSHGRNRVWAGRHIATRNAPVIIDDGAVFLGEHRARSVPHIRRPTESHDQQDWLAFALFVPIDFHATVLSNGHGASEIIASRSSFCE